MESEDQEAESDAENEHSEIRAEIKDLEEEEEEEEEEGIFEGDEALPESEAWSFNFLFAQSNSLQCTAIASKLWIPLSCR